MAPAQSLAARVESLEPQGVLAVLFWPTDIEEDGPFAWLRAEMNSRIGRPDTKNLLHNTVFHSGGTWVCDELAAHAASVPRASKESRDGGEVGVCRSKRRRVLTYDNRRSTPLTEPHGITTPVSQLALPQPASNLTPVF